MIVAVVVTYSAGADMVGRCVSALRSTPGLGHVVVVDTGRQGLDLGDDPAATPPVELIEIANRGFGAAANVGFARAAALGATSYALLNDDVVVHPGWLAPLAAHVGDGRNGVGAAQPKLLYADSQPVTINSLGVVVGPDGAGVDIAIGEPDRSSPTAVIPAFTGGAVLLSKRFVDTTGGFDERYFLYYEDVDLAARGRRLGWKYLCVPTSVVEHVGSASTASQPDRTRYLQERNRLWCAFRNSNAPTIGRALWLSVRRLRHEPRLVHARALAAGLAGAPRRLLDRATGRTAGPRSVAIEQRPSIRNPVRLVCERLAHRRA